MLQSELRVALQCLVHPWSLLSLAVLALNDHWWKHASPSWLTGKLSDLAGLFFFPFLLTACAAIIAGPRWDRRLPVARSVFWGVGLWFVAAKTIPAVHAATVSLVGFLVGDVSIVFDPTDAVAVAALWPAWRLYRHKAATQLDSQSRAFQVPVVCVAVLLTAATSKPQTPSVDKLVEHGGVLYAVVGSEGGLPSRAIGVYSTTDGYEWKFRRIDGKDQPLPPDVRSAYEPRTRITTPGGLNVGLEQRHIDESDSGRSHIAWFIPEERHRFMIVAGGEQWRLLDVATLPSDREIVVVAASTEGVVVRGGDGTWTRHAVGRVHPSAVRAELGEVGALIADGQWAYGVTIALLLWSLVSFLIWSASPRQALPEVRAAGRSWWSAIRARAALLAGTVTGLRPKALYLVASLFGSVIPVLMLVLSGTPKEFGTPSQALFPVEILLLPMFVLSLIPMLLGWRRFKQSADATALARARANFREPMIGGLLALVFVALWDIGVIGSFGVALGFTLFTGVALVLARAAWLDPG